MTQRSLELTAETGITFDAAVISEEALGWARTHAADLVTGVTDTTRKLVNQSVATFVETPGMTRGDLESLLAPAFGENRASMIAVTEVTRAYSEATNQHQRLIRDEVGMEMRRVWLTRRDDLTCFICGPLHGMPEEEWRAEFPNGPPGHVNCRCASALTMDDEATIRAEALAGQTAREKLLREQVAGEKPGVEQPAGPMYGRAPKGPDMTTEEMDRWLMEGLPTDTGIRERPKDWREVDSVQRSKAKDLIVSELVERTGLPYDDVNEFIGQWAMSSNDDDMRSLMLQKDAAEVFGVELSEFTKAKITKSRVQWEELIEELTAADSMGQWQGMDRESFLSDYRGRGYGAEYFPLLPSAQQQSLIRTMTEYTQEQLAGAGYGPGSTIRLRRGVRLPLDIARDWNVNDLVPIEGNAMESWSVGEDVAERFTRGRTYYTERGVIFEMDVPVEMIVGSSRTGFGCLMEGEFIVKGLPSNARIAWLGDFKVD